MFWFHQSTASVPVLDVVIVVVIWCCVSIPLSLLGAYYGFKHESIEFPTKTSSIARVIPPAPLVHQPMVGIFLSGILPFAAVYVELFFTMSSLWMDQYYCVFGFTLIVYMIMIITCSETTILLVYSQLRGENHRLWWFAFFSSGSIAFYTFIYSLYWFRTLGASGFVVTYFIYFGYMFLISFAMLLLFGTIGALTMLWFLCKVYSSIKVD
jgi:transmembrane 9 superfamily member 2/4